MVRFLIGCVILAAVCVGVVLFAGHYLKLGWENASTASESDTRPAPKPAPSPRKGPAETTAARDEQPAAALDDRQAEVADVVGMSDKVQPMVLTDGRILPDERQDVPSERDGKLVILATPVLPGDPEPPADKLLPKPLELAALAIEVPSWRGIDEEDRVLDDTLYGRFFRKVESRDNLGPGKTVVVRRKVKFRRLDVGDKVKRGQLLGIINPALAVEELVIKQEKVEGAEAEVRQAIAFMDEYQRRVVQMGKLRSAIRVGVTDDDFGAAKATYERYKAEKEAKRAAVRQAARELSQAWTTLKMYEVRASIDGVIKAIYKQPGEAVKNLDPVLQIQNPDKLRVEVQVEVQEALALRDRIREAERLREEAQKQRDESAARALLQQASRLLSVDVEATRIEAPRAVLAGHHQEVTCVAVCGGPRPRIISGSEDQTVRIWERTEGSKYRWHEKTRIDHHAVVRAVACSQGEKKWLLTGTATGRARLFDLDNLKAGETMLRDKQDRPGHSGAINAVAFSADGKLCATAGEDRAICLWQTSDGALLGRRSSAHGAGVTSLAFTPDGRLVSAGKDRRLMVWTTTGEGGEGGRSLERALTLERRGGEVAQLGVNSKGDAVLFDEGREVRVVSLKDQRIEGTVSNPPGTAAFSTLALYSPDGTTVLTNSNAAGRLQLWRTPSAAVRGSELRNYAWSSGNVTSAAFDPAGKFLVTGTQDARVLIWRMPDKAEAEEPLRAQLSYVEEFLDTSLRRVTVRATLGNPKWLPIPGSTATVVVPPLPSR